MNIVQWLLVIYTFASTPATSYVFSPKSLLEHVVAKSSLVRIICNVFFLYLHQSNLYDCSCTFPLYQLSRKSLIFQLFLHALSVIPLMCSQTELKKVANIHPTLAA